MKKILIILLAAALLLTAGCGAKEPEPTQGPTQPTAAPTQAPTEAPTQAPTEAPTEPVPQTLEATVQADMAPAILTLLNRGDSVDVVGQYDETHFVVKTAQGYGLMENQLLRPEGEAEYESWSGYAKSKGNIYPDYQLSGQPLMSLKVNTKVTVLEKLDCCYLVQVEDTVGYMYHSSVSAKKYSTGGGSSSGGADGGDISLEGGIELMPLAMAEQAGDVSGQATVRIDNAPVVLGYFQRGDVAPVVAEEGFAPAWEGCYTLYLDGLYAYLPENLALAQGQAAYESWKGYTAKNALLYDSWVVLGEGTKLSTNTQVTVVWDGGSFYVVEVDGQVGYMAADKVSAKKYSTGGGSSSGGDWTPPAL